MAKNKQREGTRCKTKIKHTFTVEEFRERTMHKNKLEREMELKEEQRASANATAKAEIKALQSQVVNLRNQLDEGAEDREVDAVCVMNRKSGVKTFYRHCPQQPGHGDKIRVETMTEEEFQNLPLDDGESPKTVTEPEPEVQTQEA